MLVQMSCFVRKIQMLKANWLVLAVLFVLSHEATTEWAGSNPPRKQSLPNTKAPISTETIQNNYPSSDYTQQVTSSKLSSTGALQTLTASNIVSSTRSNVRTPPSMNQIQLERHQRIRLLQKIDAEENEKQQQEQQLAAEAKKLKHQLLRQEQRLERERQQAEQELMRQKVSGEFIPPDFKYLQLPVGEWKMYGDDSTAAYQFDTDKDNETADELNKHVEVFMRQMTLDPDVPEGSTLRSTPVPKQPVVQPTPLAQPEVQPFPSDEQDLVVMTIRESAVYHFVVAVLFASIFLRYVICKPNEYRHDYVNANTLQRDTSEVATNNANQMTVFHGKIGDSKHYEEDVQDL